MGLRGSRCYVYIVSFVLFFYVYLCILFVCEIIYSFRGLDNILDYIGVGFS